MTQAVITVAGIAPPGQGKKQGKVTDTVGGVWNVWADKLNLFNIGATYAITYEENEFKGQRFFVIKTATPQGTMPGMQQRAPSTHPNPPGIPPTTAKDEMIFVCGALNNALANPNIQPFSVNTTEMVAFINLVRQCWRLTLAKGPTPVEQGQQAMDDQIPF